MSIRDALHPDHELADVLAEIRDALQIARRLERLECRVAILEERRSESVPGLAAYVVPASGMANFRKALQLVRDVLDCEGDVEPGRALPIDTRKRLFDVEALLSAELGQPVWEGRRE